MKREHSAGRGVFPYFRSQNNGLQSKQASILSPLVAYSCAKGTRKEWRPIYSRMEEHVVVYRDVSAAKGKSKVKRPRQLEDAEDGDKLEHLRSELDSLTSLLSLEESEEPDENLSAELDRLPSPEPQEPKELEEPEEAKPNLEERQNDVFPLQVMFKQKLKATSSFIESMEKDLDENDELKDEGT